MYRCTSIINVTIEKFMNKIHHHVTPFVIIDFLQLVQRPFVKFLIYSPHSPSFMSSFSSSSSLANEVESIYHIMAVCRVQEVWLYFKGGHDNMKLFILVTE